MKWNNSTTATEMLSENMRKLSTVRFRSFTSCLLRTNLLVLQRNDNQLSILLRGRGDSLKTLHKANTPSSSEDSLQQDFQLGS